MIKWTKEEGRKERREVRRKEGKYKTLLWDCHIPTAVIQNTIQGCRLLWIYYFSFSFLHSPPLKNFIFSFSIPRTWEYCKRWSRALPSPVKGSNSTPWSAPGPRPSHCWHQSWGHNKSEGPARIPDWEFRKAKETSHLFVVFALSQSLDCVSPLVIIDLAQEQANYSRGSMSWLPTCRSEAERDCLCPLQLVHSMPGRLRKTVIIVQCPLSCSPPHSNGTFLPSIHQPHT